MGPQDHTLTPADGAKGRREAEENARARMELKQAVTDGDMSFMELLQQGQRGNGDLIAGRIPIGEALDAIKGVGKANRAKILTAADFDGHVHINSLNEVERMQLCQAVNAAGFDSGTFG